MTEYALSINGQPVRGAGSFDVINPATGSAFARAPGTSSEQLDAAIAAAEKAFTPWAAAPDADRRAAVHRMADLIEANAAELARLLTLEQGKPLKGLGSEFELGGCVAWARHTAELALDDKLIEDSAKQRVELRRRPVGVVGSITPWNWPLMIAIWHVAPAIRAGCTVVLKPSSLTPLSTLRMVALCNEVLPPGVLNVVTGDADAGRHMSSHPAIRKIIFTGSTRTGRDVMERSASTLKRLTLELGGNDAGIVLPDANPAAIAEGLFWGAFINGGQTCAALKRLYVHDALYDDVCENLARVVRAMPMGDGLDPGNVMGPVQNAAQFNRVRELVDDAVDCGGQILCGGSPAAGPGYFYPLTLVTNVSDGVRLVDEEQFGPALPIIRYSSIEDAVQRANASDVGLGGSIWSSDPAAARRLAARLDCGTAWINKHGDIAPHIPFGGVKASGFGVEFAEDGLLEYTTIQIINGAR
jgi:acyl-CoA reductase-like NAD-dependent aldehyde dehydrogenase